MTNTRYGQEQLESEFAKISAKNPRFSLRSFARHLGISPSMLSEVLNGKRRFSFKTGQRVAERLRLSPRQKDLFLGSVTFHHPARASEPAPQEYLNLEEDQFRAIADWYHFALLALPQLKNHRNDPEWISGRLGISPITVRDALKRLERLGLLSSENQKLRRLGAPVKVASKVPSSAIREYHRQTLKRALDAVDDIDTERRHLGALTVTLNSRDYARATAKIEAFKESFLSEFPTEDLNSIYTLSVQFVPVVLDERKKK